MKKKSESGKNFRNKSPNDGVTVYRLAERDAYLNLGWHGGRYTGHLRKCYTNGFSEGQRHRAAEKQLAERQL